jgi:hypothetical protein
LRHLGGWPVSAQAQEQLAADRLAGRGRARDLEAAQAGVAAGRQA